ncbi:MarR family winged helix-turn-helix transcriptional regulator [Mobilicoccus massiliensis]|uniref:MarR family winged helix-turn-helix transcriptional regulator n=1 Tax=Mobilicoccus massiliensis TaxID=1522310 RepID=UPI00058EC68D|nr:MarR family transcriptional regulator [Mobilicoccus massiliensis]
MTESPWLDEPSQHVWRRWLHVTSRLPGAISAQLQADSNLSSADFSVLVQLSEAPGERYRIAELADTLQWERSRLSHQLTRMQKRGLVRREECEHDGRGAFAVLTDEGRERITQAAPGHARLIHCLFFEDLPAEELEALDRILTRLATRIDEAAPSGA